MASGVNVKMGVSGVSQFKQSINSAKQAVKTLDAQLALSEKQFKASGDAETYMAEKSALLEAKLENQKNVLAETEKALETMRTNGVDRASKAYQDMYRQMVQAKADILDTENAMNGVADAGDKAADGVDSMNQQLQRIGDGVSWENVSNGLHTINQGISSAITHAWKLGEALVQATLGAGSWADELATTAAQYSDLGIDEVDLQRMRKTANQIDTDVDTILESRSKLQKNMEEGNKNAMGALEYLGIDPSGKENLDLFWEAGEAIAKLGEEEDKVHYAQALFGKSWRELLPLFQAGREEYDELNDSWSVVEKDQLDGLKKMDDQYNKMRDEWNTFKMELLTAFSGPLTEGMETITGLFKQMNEYLDTPEGQALLQQLGDTISSLISDLTNVDPEAVVNGLKSALDSITGGLKWIDENKGTVLTALKVIAGGFALLKAAEVATNIGKIVSGFQTLWNGAHNPLPNVNGGSPVTPTTSPTTGGEGGGGWLSFAKYAAGALAFVSVLTENARKPQGNDDIIDENGQLTEVGYQAGAYIDENGEMQMGARKGRKYSDIKEAQIQELWDVYRTGSLDKKTFDRFMDSWTWEGDETRQGLLDDLYKFTQNTPDWKNVTDLPETFFQEATDNMKDAGKKMDDAAQEVKQLPADTAKAVKDALNGAQVVINGAELTAVVGQVMAGLVAHYTV